MGKTHSKPLAARHGRGTAWTRHAMCESDVGEQLQNFCGKQRTNSTSVTQNKLPAGCKHDTKCTCKVTLRRVCITTVAIEAQQYIVCALLYYVSLSTA